MRQKPVAAHRGAARAAELQARYGTDAALDVRFNDEEGFSELPNGGRAAVCTDCARFIRSKEPSTKIVGYSHEDNPSGASELAFGHDFAIVDDRYIVDPWVVGTAGESSRAVFDLENPLDANEIRRLYGDPGKWELVEKAFPSR